MIDLSSLGLFPFQQDDVDKLADPPSGLDASDMGTGKTYKGIALDLMVRDEAPTSYRNSPTLVIAPLSVLGMWEAKFNELAPQLKTYRINPQSKKTREWFYKAEADVYILHWDALRLMPDLAKQKWLHIIGDEIHRGQNRKAQQTTALKRIKAPRKFGASGTPVTSKPEKYQSILNWLYPTNKEFRSFWRFYEEYVVYHIEIGPNGPYKVIDGYKNLDALLEKVEPFYVRHLKRSECCPHHPQGVFPELPDKYYCTPLETPIMMNDFSFKSIDQVSPGDIVMGWKEAENVGTRKKLIASKVLSIGHLQRPLLEAKLASGRVIRCTPDHLWRNGVTSNVQWIQLGALPDGRKNKAKTLLHIVDPPRKLTPDEQEAAIWLGGIFDGEGSFCHSPTGDHWSVFQSQEKNYKVHKRIKEVLDKLEIPYIQNRNGDNFQFPTTRDVALKILTWCKPVKNETLERFILERGVTADKVIEVNKIEGLHDVAWLETETGNYIAWGYASKNSEIVVELKPEQRRAFNEMKKDMLAWVGANEDQPVVAPIAIAKLTRCYQFSSAYAQVNKLTGLVELTEPSSKLDALMGFLADNPNEQVVVFSQFKQLIKLLEARLNKAKITHVLLTGDIPELQRKANVDAFQAGKARVFCGTIAAGGVGITLTAASTVVMLDRKAGVPSLNFQAEDRCWRYGQKNAVQVIDIIAKGTADRERAHKLEVTWSWLKKMLGDS